MEVYSFEQNSWISSTNQPVLTLSHALGENTDRYWFPKQLIFQKNYGFAVLFKKILCLLHQETQMLQYVYSLPYEFIDESISGDHSIISQDKTNKILYVSYNKLYCFSLLNRRWELKKNWPLLKYKNKSVYNAHLETSKILTCNNINIIAIHNPIVRF